MSTNVHTGESCKTTDLYIVQSIIDQCVKHNDLSTVFFFSYVGLYYVLAILAYIHIMHHIKLLPNCHKFVSCFIFSCAFKALYWP